MLAMASLAVLSAQTKAQISGSVGPLRYQRCAGVGLEFTAASAVVFVELPDEVSILLQAEDRAHRHGQQMAVNIYYLLARGTSDERKCVHLYCYTSLLSSM